MNSDTSFPVRWGRWVTGHPFLTLLGGLLLALGMGFGAGRITMSTDYRYFFGKTNPQRITFERLQDIYSKDDNIFLVVSPEDGTVFKPETIEALLYLTEESWQIPYSTRVDSLTNFQHSFAEEDDLTVKDLILVEELESGNVGEMLARAKATALQEPLLLNRMINPDASITGISILTNFPGESITETPEAAAAIRELASRFEEKFPGHRIDITGVTMLNNAFNEAGMKDMSTLMPAMFGIILVILFVLLRSFSGVLATFLVMIFSIMWGMGFAGWIGIPLTPPSSIVPVIVMTLAIADSIHLIRSMQTVLPSMPSRRDAVIEALRVNFKPVFLTSLTTVVGFLSLNFSDTPPFHDLGNMTSVGVTAAFFYSITILPALMSLLPMKIRKETKQAGALSERYGHWIVKRKTPVLILSAAIAVILGLQIPRIELNDEFIGYFDRSIPFRVASEYAMDNLTGIYQINFDMQSGESQGISDPEFLQHVENFSQYLAGVEGVVHVNTLTDTFKRLNRNMHGDDPSYHRLPEERDLAAQYLLLYEMSLPYGLDLNNQIDVDKSSTRVVANLGDLTTAQILEITTAAETWLVENTPENLHTIGSSPVIMFSHISKRNVIAMAWGTLLAFGLITIVMIIALRSFKYGLLSLIPNVIPMVLSYGIWSLLVGEAGFVIAIVGSVTLGIAVDDTVHFLSKYYLARKEKGMASEAAIQYAFRNVGSALVMTSIILVIGFSVLTFSTFKMNYILGALSAMTIALALLVDCTLLPAVLRIADSSSTPASSN